MAGVGSKAVVVVTPFVDTEGVCTTSETDA